MNSTKTLPILISFEGCGDTERRFAVWKGRTEDGRFLSVVFRDGQICYGLRDFDVPACEDKGLGFHEGWIIRRDEMIKMLSKAFDVSSL